MPVSQRVRLEWTGERLAFSGQGVDPPSPAVAVDGDRESGPSPMQTLLLAVAGCSSADVVVILKKMRVRLETLAVEVDGVRRDEEPRRYVAMTLRFRMRGQGLDAAKAERAVGLSLEKYCSVIHSLAPDTEVRHEIVLE